MKKNKYSFNRHIMMGIMAMAVLVLTAVVVFWMWCFPDGGMDIHKKECTVAFSKGFTGDSLQVLVDDSLIYCGRPVQDSLLLKVPAVPDCAVMVVMPSDGTVYTFTPEPHENTICLQKNEEGVSKVLPKDKNTP